MDVANTEEGGGLIPQVVPSGLVGGATPTPKGLQQLAEQEQVIRSAARRPETPSGSRNLGDIVLKILTFGAAAATIALLVIMVTALLYQSWNAITHFGFSFLSLSANAVVPFSVSVAIEGTIYTSLLALLFAAPVGLLIAIFLAEMAHGRLSAPLGFLVEFLAAVPSII